MLIKLHIIAIDIQENEFICNRLLHLIITYCPSIILHFCINETNLVHYNQLCDMDIYDFNAFL